MTSCQELSTQFTVVVELPVEDNLDRAIFIAERLSAAGQIDNGKTPMNKSNSGLPPVAFTVRTTMGNRITHALQIYRIHGPLSIEIHDSCNSTHIKSSTRSDFRLRRSYCGLGRLHRFVETRRQP